MYPKEYIQQDAIGLARLISSGELSAAEVRAVADRCIDSVNPKLNAVISRSMPAEVAGPDAPLTGVPTLLKDLGVLRVGETTANGVGMLPNLQAEHNSTLVARMETAGLQILGRSNTPELGVTFTTEPRTFGPTRNPWGLCRSPGGSSGGAAAAVASGMVPVAHGSDGGGSIRVPAAWCGVFGLKPSRGRVPAGPDLGDIWGGLAVGHVVSRSVRDSAAVLDVLAGPEPGDPYASPPAPESYLGEVGRGPGRLHIALQTNLSDRTCDAACAEAAQETARLCDELGHEVAEDGPQIDRDSFIPAFLTVLAAHLTDDIACLEYELGRPIADTELSALSAELRRRGKSLPIVEYAQARATLQNAGRRLGEFFRKYDLLLNPSTAVPPVPLEYLDMDNPDVAGELKRIVAVSPFPQLANATGCPSMSLPLGWSPDGLPLGSMFTAPLGREDVLFRLAGQLEAAKPWWHCRPPVHAAAA